MNWTVRGENGHVEVFDHLGEKVAEVDVSDPLETSDLARFWREAPVPEDVKYRVEAYASQWRRIISTTPAWQECLRRERERYKEKRRPDDPIGSWMWPDDEAA